MKSKESEDNNLKTILSNGKAYEPAGYDYIVDPDSGDPYAVSRSTGEVADVIFCPIVAGSIIYTPEQLEAINKRKEAQQEFLKQKTRLDELGQFSFVCASQQFEDISPETAARLIYLSTFLKWQSDMLRLTQRSQMNRDNLPEIMGLSRQTVSRFLDEVSPKYITLDDDGNIYMNPECFWRGKIGRHGESTSWRKIYIDSVKKLYRLAGKNKHRYLGYVFRMLPYISIEYNGLCSNIFEKDLNLVQFMTDKEFCNRIDYSYAAVSRLKDIYRGIRFDVDGHLEPFCAFVEVWNTTKIYVNPHILYNGTRPDIVAVLGNFCNGA